MRACQPDDGVHSLPMVRRARGGPRIVEARDNPPARALLGIFPDAPSRRFLPHRALGLPKASSSAA